MATLCLCMLQSWRTATIDYSAANEYVSTHYPHLHTGNYFAHGTPSGFLREPIYNGRAGVYDDSTHSYEPASLATCGFALLRSHTIIAPTSDWRDADAVRANYLPGLRRLVTDAVEASAAHVQMRITRMFSIVLTWWQHKIMAVGR